MLVALQFVGIAATPLNVTVLVPCDAPKLVPVIVTEVPTGPEVGFKLASAGVTVKGTALLAKPTAVTITLPVAAPVGTGTMMLVTLQLVGVAAVPLNVTVLGPWLAPKLDPAIVMDVPTGPDVGFRLVMVGGGVTVKATPLLATPPTATTTLPVVVPLGSGTAIDVALQLIGVARVPLKVTVLVPCVVPKLPPVIVTNVPTGPVVGLRPVTIGAGVIEKLTWLLASPKTTT
jgi:hypothetical protein